MNNSSSDKARTGYRIMPEAQPQQIPTIGWLLQSGGLAPLAFGLILAVVGLIFVIRPNRTAGLMIAVLSLLPAIFGLVVVYSAAVDYVEMAASPRVPKPSEFAEITGRAMGSSFCALLGTIVPLFVAVLAQSRAYNTERITDVATETRSETH
jgi:hypothetical protein